MNRFATFSIIVVLYLILSACFKKENSSIAVIKVGEFKNQFDYTLKRWQGIKEYRDNQNVPLKNYVVLEYCWTSGAKYNYVLVDLDDNKIDKSELGEKSSKQIEGAKLESLINKLNGLEKKNNVFDATNLAKDGNIYFVRYYKNFKLKNKFGSYTLEKNSKSQNEDIISAYKTNNQIIRDIIELGQETLPLTSY